MIERLTGAQGEQVRALAARARSVDGVDPLNEEAYRSLGDDSALHLLRANDDGVVGYLNYSERFATAQLVVDPDHRRSGIATDLWTQRPADPSLGIWAFGNLAAAQGFAAARRLRPERGLLMMSRALTDLPLAEVPPQVELRAFTPADADELLALNAAAFAHHPEQGQLDHAGLAARLAEDWFDPEGLIVAFDATGMVGFHWTKQVDTTTGEVYVIAVAPRCQGRGYGKVLLTAGMSHLATQGLPTVELYVDTADQTAVRMYQRAGFVTVHRDVRYRPIQEQE